MKLCVFFNCIDYQSGFVEPATPANTEKKLNGVKVGGGGGTLSVCIEMGSTAAF